MNSCINMSICAKYVGNFRTGKDPTKLIFVRNFLDEKITLFDGVNFDKKKTLLPKVN